MYEFTDKKIKEEFKKTEYGKKTNKIFWISVIIYIFVFLTTLFFLAMYFIKNIENVDYGKVIEMSFPFIITMIIACYFDGNRDGAIEQFKRNMK